MERDFKRLADGPFDLLVIGGGVYGSWVAYDAALRGLHVALIEKTDWAAATSSASSKLIHGGLRYLERGHFRLVRKNLDERRRLARLAPHRVRPLRFVLPVYDGEAVAITPPNTQEALNGYELLLQHFLWWDGPLRMLHK